MPEMPHCRFKRAAAEAKAKGSRKSEEELITQLAQKYNAEEPELKLKTDEMYALKFLSRRSDEFLAVLSLIWGQERPEFTAAPLSIFCEKWLQEEEPLAVSGPQLSCHGAASSSSLFVVAFPSGQEQRQRSLEGLPEEDRSSICHMDQTDLAEVERKAGGVHVQEG